MFEFLGTFRRGLLLSILAAALSWNVFSLQGAWALGFSLKFQTGWVLEVAVLVIAWLQNLAGWGERFHFSARRTHDIVMRSPEIDINTLQEEVRRHFEHATKSLSQVDLVYFHVTPWLCTTAQIVSTIMVFWPKEQHVAQIWA